MTTEGLLLYVAHLFGLLSSYMPKNYIVIFDNLWADIRTRFFFNFSDSGELKTIWLIKGCGSQSYTRCGAQLPETFVFWTPRRIFQNMPLLGALKDFSRRARHLCWMGDTSSVGMASTLHSFLPSICPRRLTAWTSPIPCGFPLGLANGKLQQWVERRGGE